MTSRRSLHSIVAVLAALGGACSSSDSPAAGTGGTHDTGGLAGSGRTTANGDNSGGGGANGKSGAPGRGGTTGGGGTTQSGTGGASASGGRSGSGSGGAAGQPGSGRAGAFGASSGIGGSARGGSVGSGGATQPGSGGATSSGSDGGPGGSGAEGGVVQSDGCGKSKTLQNGTITISVGGASRKYILRVPDGYDNSHPYRLVIAYAESGSSAQSVADRKYFSFATQDSKNTIFAAPDASNGAGSWSKTDVDFTDAILAQLEGDLCIDKTRIFATGFSFGGAMSIAIACTRADVFRAVSFFSGADLTGACPTKLTKPIAYWASQASEDANGMSRTDPMTGEMKQSQFAAVNGCTAEPNSTTFPSSGQPHTCTTYTGCSESVNGA
jgi:poly(3-hydroxybutyrate) depolymerase